MKKLTALVLSFGMLFSMAACSGSKVNDDALDKLEASVKKFSEGKCKDKAVWRFHHRNKEAAAA